MSNTGKITSHALGSEDKWLLTFSCLNPLQDHVQKKSGNSHKKEGARFVTNEKENYSYDEYLK